MTRSANRLDPVRAIALVMIAAGVLLIFSFVNSMWVAVEDQNRLDQAWRQQVVVPAFTPANVDPLLKRPIGGVDFAIQVPKLGYFAVVKEGISSGVLYSGPGHYPETPWPGDQGTVGVAAHNEYWINFPKLAVGDEVDLQTRYGLYRYHVTGHRIVNPSDRSVLVPQSGGHHLTLTTCWPVWAGVFATQRYVIFTDQYYPAPPAPPPTTTS
ncbi:MAG TPA: class D sortase [Candidatus Dormibacteraeota bacterium]|nr:class D sortase [Candidatus Dormibacteraeota bacterium]